MGASLSDSYDSELAALTREPHYPLGHVLLSNASLLRAVGLRNPPGQLLGRGAFGAAYEIPARGRTVLKLTRDPTEVQASSRLSGRDNRRIVPIYGVWYLANTYLPGLRRWYVVHRGYLHPLEGRDKDLVELIFGIYDEVALDLTLPRSPKQHAMIDKWRGYIRRELMGDGGIMTDDEGLRVGVTSLGVGKLVKRTMQLLLQIGAAVDEMHAAGIDWEDIHSDNMMRNDEGRLTIADVGWGLMHEDFEAEIDALSPELIREHFASDAYGPSSSSSSSGAPRAR